MRIIDSELQETDIAHLLALRAARVRHAPLPGVPTDSAQRLADHGYVRSDARGGVEITDQGLRYLEGRFLFCEAFGCDGVLRRWTRLSTDHAGHDPADPMLDEERRDTGDVLRSIRCPKCGSRNVLADLDHPTRLSHYRIGEVLPSK